MNIMEEIWKRMNLIHGANTRQPEIHVYLGKDEFMELKRQLRDEFTTAVTLKEGRLAMVFDCPVHPVDEVSHLNVVQTWRPNDLYYNESGSISSEAWANLKLPEAGPPTRRGPPKK